MSAPGAVQIRLIGKGWNLLARTRVGMVVSARKSIAADNEYTFDLSSSEDDRTSVTYRGTTRPRSGYLVEVLPASEANAVVHPNHYNDVEGMPEVWDILDAFFPDNPTMWNAGKYLLRYARKGEPAEQLRKMVQYANRELEKLDAGKD